jgi:hypothetical protein
MATSRTARASSASWRMAENGLPLDDFRILTPLTDAVTVDDHVGAESQASPTY